ncbi:putative methyltransferase BTM2 [Novymonas esmeraldas]|uniref:Methyltransferase BTM2 n=1 Tax=Novymonas esmeraldas TaxID=1808958 RepID=A0AAW0EXD4_9TRYP
MSSPATPRALSGSEGCAPVLCTRTSRESSPAPPQTARPGADGDSTEHLGWAALIKEQHRHLQAAVQSSAATVTTPAAGGADASALRTQHHRHHIELEAWRSSLDGEAAAQRLSAYATAMHHLATRYWDPPTARAERDLAMNTTATATHDGLLTAPPRPGEKRRRGCCVDADDLAHEPQAGNAATDAPRHYSDRLRYTLESLASYYLGEAEATEVGDASLPDTLRGAAAAASPPIACFRVRVGETCFRQLPGVVARVVKPLRRLFFQRHGRMATEAEVGQLVSACCPPSPPHSSSADALVGAEVVAGDGLLQTSGLAPRRASVVDGCPVQVLLADDADARAVVAESVWRRGRGTAWAAALRYTHPASCVVAAEPPPLWVLDVGSCYGPFAGQSLSRAPPHAAVPLRVTSMDLAPYQAEGDCGADADAVPAPRVWCADWLRIDFFEGAEAGTAEEGRIRFERRGAEGHVAATAVRLESYDAVFFCLLLSYMPTPRLRLLACLHAFLALKEGGLLVVVSTRTQGPRRRDWMAEWTACLATVGLQRVQQSIQEKIVGMSFVKVSPSAAVRQSVATAEGRAAWVDAMMASAAAAKGLRITADDAQDRADL